MATSEDIDRKRRHAKRMRFNWAQVLVRPQTLKVPLASVKLIAQVIGLLYELNRILRE
jgi:hypothetical protein